MPTIIHRDSKAWQMQVWISFLIAVFLCAVGLSFLPGTDIDRAFMIMGYLFCLSMVFVLSKYLRDYHGRNKPYKGRILIGRITPEPDNEKVKKAISFGMDELTRPYDNWEICRIAMRILFKRGRKIRDRKYICSELVYEAFRKAEVAFKFNRSSISPDDIWNDGRVVMKFRIM